MNMEIDLAYFNGKPAFKIPKSTSNLIKPDKERYKEYLKLTFGKESSTNINNSILKLFEKRFAELHNVKYCIPATNGLWALVMAIDSLRIPKRKEIIMPSLTYRRMADIAAWLNLVPRFCDVDKFNFGVNKNNIKECITSETALVLAPHPIVNICDIEGITNLCNEHNLPLLFDSVESYYAEFNGKTIGGFGDAECFSLHASKFINGFEGGYITTNNRDLAKKLREKLSGGKVSNTNTLSIGFNLPLIDFHAAMALACLDNLEKQLKHNIEVYNTYKTRIKNIPGINLIEYDYNEKRSFKNILFELTEEWPLSRNITMEILNAENLLARPYYYPTLHETKREYKTIFTNLPNTIYWKDRLLLMPCGEFVSTDDVHLIMDIIEKIRLHSKAISLSYEKK